MWFYINKDGYIYYTRSCEGGSEAVEVLPLSFWTIMFDDLFCAKVIGSMCCSNQARKKKTLLLHYIRPVKTMTTLTKELHFWETGLIHFMQREHTARQFHLQPALQGFHLPDPPLAL